MCSCLGTPGVGSRFERHGPLRMSASRRHLAHADGTPFLWLGDTGWNAALQATGEEWQHYARTRLRQGFAGIQFVPYNWFVSPAGDRDGELGWIGRQRIAVNPVFFQRLDGRIEHLNRMGLAAALVLLWSSPWQHPLLAQTNPGLVLPLDQAVLLARYEIARWGAWDVLWILNGDGDYRGEKAERWRQIGRAVFGDRPHAPVSLHPCGVNWPYDDFADEAWLDIAGYQSGHDDGETRLRWLVGGAAGDGVAAGAGARLHALAAGADHARRRADGARGCPLRVPGLDEAGACAGAVGPAAGRGGRPAHHRCRAHG